MENTPIPAYRIMYHVFTYKKDLWIEDYKLARKLYNHWKKSNGSSRRYQELYEDEQALLNGEMLEEECLLSFGPFPQ